MLSEHELFHLDAMLSEVSEIKNLDSEQKNKWMRAKKIKEGQEEKYLDEIEKDIEKIKEDGIFPELECPSRIHNYIEKETKGEFK